jgi:L-cysteine/cystine lyase
MKQASTTGGRSTSDDLDKIEAIRAEMPAVQHAVYLNTGTNGPLPRRSVAALTAQAEQELMGGRITAAAWERYSATLDEARAAFAGVLHCDPLEIALTHNTTEGLNIALMGLPWQPGDELIAATSEHGGGLNPVALLRQRYGIKVHMTRIGLRGCDPVADLRAVLGPRTRAIMLSHASWATGAVLPLREIVAAAHEAGALVICDAAQSCGMVPVDVHEAGVDMYACSGQKWLCGPDGTGALYVRRDLQEMLWQSYVGFGGLRHYMNALDVRFQPVEGARRYEVASFYLPALKALSTSLQWIDELGWPWVFQRIQELGRRCYDALSALDGVRMYLPRAEVVGLLHFAVDGIPPADLTRELAERGILIRHTPEPALNRVAIGFYNADEDIERLVDAIRAVQAGRAALSEGA